MAERPLGIGGEGGNRGAKIIRASARLENSAFSVFAIAAEQCFSCPYHWLSIEKIAGEETRNKPISAVGRNYG